VILQSEIGVMIYKGKSVLECIGIHLNSHCYQNMYRTFADRKEMIY
jgi:hypothetical protein